MSITYLQHLGVFKDFSDGSLKTVFDVGGNQIIEISLLMNKESMDVICVPTHYFCCLGCKMCHLTNKGLNKQMKPIIVEHLMEAILRGVTDRNGHRRTQKFNLLISFMGVGEPLLNIPLIIDIFQHEHELKQKLGYIKINYALSTMMPNHNLIELTEIVNRIDMPLKVYFSLHSPIDTQRFDLIPSSHLIISECLSYLLQYRQIIQKNRNIISQYVDFHRTDDPVEIHYTLIDGVNDGIQQLDKLCELLQMYPITIKFIRFNPIHDLKNSQNENLWIKTITHRLPGLRVKIYLPPGREIGSSCGEFTKHYYHQEIETLSQLGEFLTWKKQHEIFD